MYHSHWCDNIWHIASIPQKQNNACRSETLLYHSCRTLLHTPEYTQVPSVHREHLTKTSNTYTSLSLHPTTTRRPATTGDEKVSFGSLYSPTTTPSDNRIADTIPDTEQAKTRAHGRTQRSHSIAAKKGELNTGRPWPISVVHAKYVPFRHRMFLTMFRRKQYTRQRKSGGYSGASGRHSKTSSARLAPKRTP